MNVMAVRMPVVIMAMMVMRMMVMRIACTALRVAMHGMIVTGEDGDGFRHCCNNIT